MNTGRSTTSAAFAAQLRAERAAANMSQDALAKASGMSLPTVKRLESNQREMDTDQLERLCRVLRVSVPDFVARAYQRLSEPAETEPARRAAQ